jgi:Rrf2 family protein
VRHSAGVQISARTDYALRALCVLATAAEGTVVKAAVIAEAQAIPRTFLDQILVDLRRAGIVESRRGPDGGHRLARPAFSVTVADVVRVMDGPLALVQGQRPEALVYAGPSAHLRDVWVAVRAALRQVLERTTLDQVVEDRLPPQVTTLSEDPRSWTSVWPPPSA